MVQDRDSLSNALDISLVANVVGLIMPPDWTPAVVSIEGSANGTDFYPIYDGMTATDLNGSGQCRHPRFNDGDAINPNRLRCCMAIRLRSGTHDAISQYRSRRASRVWPCGRDGSPVQPPATGVGAHLIEDESNGFHGIAQNFQAPGPMTVAVQAWLKSTDRQAGFDIQDSAGSGARVYFDLATNEYLCQLHPRHRLCHLQPCD